jgi:hypothetical protein
MKKLIIILLGCAIIFASCGDRPQYKTMAGKKKLNHYNALQFNKSDWDKKKNRSKKRRN